MKQVALVRGLILRKLKEFRILISCLPETEHEALAKLNGTEGVKTAARIADFVLQELGHEPPAMTPEGTSPTVRAARQVVGNGKRL